MMELLIGFLAGAIVGGIAVYEWTMRRVEGWIAWKFGSKADR